MKKIFPIIIGLISLSLIGIIVIQLLWLKNMVLLKRETVKHRIEDGVIVAASVLSSPYLLNTNLQIRLIVNTTNSSGASSVPSAATA